MRKLKINEEELKELIEDIINDNFLGINIKEINDILKRNDIKISPQILRRNILSLIKDKKVKMAGGRLKHG